MTQSRRHGDEVESDERGRGSDRSSVRRRYVLATTAVLVSLGLAGCTGGGSDATATSDVAGTEDGGDGGGVTETELSPRATTAVPAESVFASLGFEEASLVVDLAPDADVDTVTVLSSAGEEVDSASVSAGATRVSFEADDTVDTEYRIVAANEGSVIDEVTRSFSPELSLVRAASRATIDGVPVSEIDISSERTRTQITEAEGAFFDLVIVVENVGNAPVFLAPVDGGAFAGVTAGTPDVFDEEPTPEDTSYGLVERLPAGSQRELPVVGARGGNVLQIETEDGEPYDYVESFLDADQQFPEEYFGGEERDARFVLGDGDLTFELETTLRYTGGAVEVGAADSLGQGTSWAAEQVDSVDG